MFSFKIPFTARRINISHLPYKLGLFYKVLKLLPSFEHPWRIFKNYWTLKPMDSICYKGKTIHFSDCPYDLTTFFTVFAHEYYGKIPKQSVVIDVGSNIGLFALYAVWNGAIKVYAYEPNESSYATLCRNIKEHNLQDKIIPIQKGVGGEADSSIAYISKESSPFNQVTSQKKEEYTEVPINSINYVINQISEQKIDLLKIDCEGCEYELMRTMGEQQAKRINDIRIEYELHCSNTPETLIANAQKFNFHVESIHYKHKRLFLTQSNTN